MLITKKYLKSLNACEEQVELFHNTFPKGVQLFRNKRETKDNVLTALKAGLSIDWFASALGIVQFNLSRADLSEADLSGSNLSRADLYRSNLSGADLSEADLSKAIIELLPGGGYTL